MKKFVLILCCIMMVYLCTLPVYASDFTKDETVYVQLDYNGDIQGRQVVNHLFSENPLSTFTDSVKNKDLINLTDTTSPVIKDSSVQWNTEKPTTDFYYQSTSDEALPFTFNIGYLLDDKSVKGEDLTGKSGKIELTLNVKPNENSPLIYRENMMAQISMTLNSDHAMNISAPDATKVVAGKITTLNYVIMAQQSGDYRITFDATDFEMDGITISIIPNGFSLPGDIQNQMDDMTGGFDEMNSAMGQMVDGTQKLQKGMVDLSKGINTLNGGYNEFLDGTSSIVTNTQSILKGYMDITPGIQDISKASNDINSGLSSVSPDQIKALGDGLVQIQKGYESITTDQLLIIAQNLAASTDPQVQALAQAVLGVNQLNDGFAPIAQGASSSLNGMADLADNYGELNSGLQGISKGMTSLSEGSQKLIPGLDDYKKGAVQFGNGLGELNNQVKVLPNQVQQLVNGQKEFKDGINEASTQMEAAFKDFTDVNTVSFPSFVNGDSQKVNTLQFVAKTPDIKKSAEKTVEENNSQTKGFWEKLLDLFR